MAHIKEFYQPNSVAEAVDLLWELKQEGTLIAGGTDITPDIKGGRMHPAALVNVRNLTELSYIRVEQDLVRIGAATILQKLLSDLPAEAVSLRSAAQHIGNWQIRNMATVGGNLCRASSVGDLGVVFLSLDARVRLTSRGGERYCSMEDFFTGQRKVNRKPEELVTEVSFNLFRKACGEAYVKFYSTTRRSIPLVIVAVNLCLAGTPKVRAAAGGVSDKPVRLHKFEKQFNGLGSLDGLPSALDQLQHDINPINDRYSGADYKRSLCGTLVGRAVTGLYKEIQGR